MRRTAVVLSGLVAVVQLALFVLTERQLQATLAVIGPVSVPAGVRWAWAVAWALPWVAGAMFLAVGRLRSGVVVILTAAAVLLAGGLAGLAPTIEAVSTGTLPPAAVRIERLGGTVVWLLAGAAGLAAFLARPQSRWRDPGRGPAGWYVALAVLAWLPFAFQATAFAPPGAPRRFVEPAIDVLSGIDVVASLAATAVAAMILFLAPHLEVGLGGLVLVTFSGPALLAQLGGVLRVVDEPDVIFTPAGALGLMGLAGVLVAGVVWALRGAALPRPAPPGAGTPPGAEPPADGDPMPHDASAPDVDER